MTAAVVATGWIGQCFDCGWIGTEHGGYVDAERELDAHDCAADGETNG